MCGVGFAPVQAAPAKERTRPVPFAEFVRGDEFVVVDGPVGFVLRVGAVEAAVVGEAGGDAEAGAGEEDGFVEVGGLGCGRGVGEEVG